MESNQELHDAPTPMDVDFDDSMNTDIENVLPANNIVLGTSHNLIGSNNQDNTILILDSSMHTDVENNLPNNSTTFGTSQNLIDSNNQQNTIILDSSMNTGVANDLSDNITTLGTSENFIVSNNRENTIIILDSSMNTDVENNLPNNSTTFETSQNLIDSNNQQNTIILDSSMNIGVANDLSDNITTLGTSENLMDSSNREDAMIIIDSNRIITNSLLDNSTSIETSGNLIDSNKQDNSFKLDSLMNADIEKDLPDDTTLGTSVNVIDSNKQDNNLLILNSPRVINFIEEANNEINEIKSTPLKNKNDSIEANTELLLDSSNEIPTVQILESSIEEICDVVETNKIENNKSADFDSTYETDQSSIIDLLSETKSMSTSQNISNEEEELLLKEELDSSNKSYTTCSQANSSNEEKLDSSVIEESPSIIDLMSSDDESNILIERESNENLIVQPTVPEEKLINLTIPLDTLIDYKQENNSENKENINTNKSFTPEKLKDNKPNETVQPNPLQIWNLSVFSDSPARSTKRDTFHRLFDPLFDADADQTVVKETSPQGEKNQELTMLEEEINNLKLELNLIRQEKSALELERHQKDEIILKTQADFLKKESALRQETKELQDKLNSINEQNNNDEVRLLKEEIDDAKKSKSQLIDKMNLQVKELADLKKTLEEYLQAFERISNEAAEYNLEFLTTRQHLEAIEMAFNDVHAKYERSKAIITGYKSNEEVLLANLEQASVYGKKMEERYDSLKAHAKAQLDKANKELFTLKEKQHGDIQKLSTLVRRLEIKNGSIQQSLDQKLKECSDLAALCDELTGSVPR